MMKDYTKALYFLNKAMLDIPDYSEIPFARGRFITV